MKTFDKISVIITIGILLIFIFLLFRVMIEALGGVDYFIIGFAGVFLLFIIAGIFSNGMRVIIDKLNDNYDEKHGLSEK